MRRRMLFHHAPPERTRALLRVFIVCMLLIACLLYAAAQLRPLLESMATARVSNTVNRIVASAVQGSINSGRIDYEKLVTFEKDSDGHITAVKSNMAEFNRLQTEIMQLILSDLSDVSTRELSIPIGSLSASPLLAGRGPCIRVNLQTVGSSSAKFSNSFTSAGINQTRHQIILDVHVSAAILLPGFTTSTGVDSSYTVAETVIVGTVPDSYVYFHSDSVEEVEDFILNDCA